VRAVSATADELVICAGMAHALGVPCLAGIPVGHIDEQWTIPLGAMAELDTATRTLSVMSYKS